MEYRSENYQTKWMDEWDEHYRNLPPLQSPPKYYSAQTMPARPKKKPVPRKKNPTKSDRLKQFLDAKKVETVVTGDVARFLQTRPNDRDTTLIHPSEMARKDWCIRGTLLRLRGYERPKEVHNLRTELIFAEGHDIHRKWQKWFADMGILYGSWVCPACEDRILGEVLELPKIGCEGQVSGRHLWEYKEVPLRGEPNIGGHADGIILRPDGDYIFEAKSVGPGSLRKMGLLSEDESDEDTPDKFSRITHVLGEHYRQTQIYLRLSQRTDRSVDKGVVVYENKADQQVREFAIEYDESATKDAFDMAADVMWAFNNGRDLTCSNAPFTTECDQCKGWVQP